MRRRQIRPGPASITQTGPQLQTHTLGELYDEHGARLYRYAVLLLADRSAAEDAIQQAFLNVALSLERGREVSFAYLATAVRNECYTLLRRRRRQPAPGEPVLDPLSPEASEEERLVLESIVRTLPAGQREVLYLKVFEGLTFQEIAARCGIGINTAASRYRYATGALRRALAGPESARD